MGYYSNVGIALKKEAYEKGCLFTRQGEFPIDFFENFKTSTKEINGIVFLDIEDYNYWEQFYTDEVRILYDFLKTIPSEDYLLKTIGEDGECETEGQMYECGMRISRLIEFPKEGDLKDHYEKNVYCVLGKWDVKNSSGAEILTIVDSKEAALDAIYNDLQSTFFDDTSLKIEIERKDVTLDMTFDDSEDNNAGHYVEYATSIHQGK